MADTAEFHTERILVTVKTYPTAHPRRGEVVCTAGVNEVGEWRRVWPVGLRALEPGTQFKRYEWIEASIRKSRTDPRKESFVVDEGSIRRTGLYIPTKRDWQLRRDVLIPRASRSVEELIDLHAQDNTSMGLIKPRRIDSLSVELVENPEWSQDRQHAIDQLNLLAVASRPLEMLPFKLKLAYHCKGSSCRGHEQIITDWEVGAFYYNRVRRSRDPENAAEAVRKHFERYFTSRHDTWLFLGTNHPVWPTFIVTGLFYPPAQRQPSLFESLAEH